MLVFFIQLQNARFFILMKKVIRFPVFFYLFPYIIEKSMLRINLLTR
jgi:hypothetical protein